MRRLRSWWSWDGLAILLGFTLTVASLVGAPTYLAPALTANASIDAEIAAKRARLETTRAALALDNLAQQLGGNVFAIQPDPTRDPAAAETLRQLRRRQLDHRHDGVRAFIAALGVAGEVDFNSASAAYAALVDAEKRDFTLSNFQAANAFEAALASKVVEHQVADQARIAVLQRSRVAARRESGWRATVLTLASSLGATFLLIATLRASVVASPASPAPLDDPRETAIAALAAALGAARARAGAGAP